MSIKGEWIWYPGDFEIMLGLRVWSSRSERGTYLNPDWKIDTSYPKVKFRKTFELENDTVVFINAHGNLAVHLDNSPWFERNVKNGINIKKGKHSISLEVFNAKELPSVYIDHPVLKTDNTWEASVAVGKWVKAGGYNFTDPQKPPHSFSLSTEEIEPVSQKSVNNGTLYDFGKEIMAFLQLTNVEGGSVVQICYGESEIEALDINGCELYDEPFIDGEFVTENTRAFRYVFIPDSNNIKIGKIVALSQYLPLTNRGDFSCENEKINRIYDTALYTLHLNSREFFLDGIKRDRWVWSGDATQSYLLNFYSFFDTDICKRTMRLLRGKDPILNHLNTIQDYTCYWFISLYNYYLYTGDRSFLEDIYEDAKSLMDYCLSLTDERGFLMARPEDWVFVDWAPITTKGDISIIQLLFARALEAMATLANINGSLQDELFYKNAFEKTLENCKKVFWNEDLGCYMHGPAREKNAVVTRYANMFAVLFGYAEGKEKDSIVSSVLLNQEILPITTPYMKYYELMALCEAGATSTVLEYIESYWGGMLDEGATTFWEEYNPLQKGAEKYAMYGRPYGKSLCHAWGGGPIVLLGKYILGVSPTLPGYKEFTINPLPSGLKEIHGKVPTPTGEIEVSLKDGTITVNNDTDGKGSLYYNEKIIDIPPHSKVNI